MVIELFGVPASGKSTLANELARQNETAKALPAVEGMLLSARQCLMVHVLTFRYLIRLFATFGIWKPRFIKRYCVSCMRYSRIVGYGLSTQSMPVLLEHGLMQDISDLLYRSRKINDANLRLVVADVARHISIVYVDRPLDNVRRDFIFRGKAVADIFPSDSESVIAKKLARYSEKTDLLYELSRRMAKNIVRVDISNSAICAQRCVAEFWKSRCENDA